MKRETYEQARKRLLAELNALGWTAKPELKRPWAEPPSRAYRVTFNAQSVLLGGYSHWIDIRGMSVMDFVGHCEKARPVFRG